MEAKNREEELRKLEAESKIKYEKYKPQMIITCQKCGSTKSLMKVKHNGEDFWFCRNCVMKRAKELKENKSES